MISSTMSLRSRVSREEGSPQTLICFATPSSIRIMWTSFWMILMKKRKKRCKEGDLKERERDQVNISNNTPPMPYPKLMRNRMNLKHPIMRNLKTKYCLKTKTQNSLKTKSCLTNWTKQVVCQYKIMSKWYKKDPTRILRYQWIPIPLWMCKASNFSS